MIKGNNITYQIIIKYIDKFIKKGNVLDIGCGAGTIDFYLASKGNTVVGIDISQRAVESARESAKLMDLKNVKFEAMEFPHKVPGGNYDYVLCSEVLEHLPDDKHAMKKIFNLLNKKGIAILSTPSKNAPLYKLGYASGFDKRVGHLRRYTVEELKDIAKNAGFTVIATEKTEGVLRNFLFLNPIAGKLIRFIKFSLVDIVSFLDYISLKLFGESQIFIVVQKP